jgi:hypothetical protein
MSCKRDDAGEKGHELRDHELFGIHKRASFSAFIPRTTLLASRDLHEEETEGHAKTSSDAGSRFSALRKLSSILKGASQHHHHHTSHPQNL